MAHTWRSLAEWHEECNGPICQGCEACICEGGCACEDGPAYTPAVAKFPEEHPPGGSGDR